MERPNFRTAIPKRRYRLGEFTITILGEIDSEEIVEYQYILAVVREGDSQPGMYLTAEKRQAGQKRMSDYEMRLIMQDGTQVVGTSEHWKELEIFAKDALQMVQTILNLQDEEPRQLL